MLTYCFNKFTIKWNLELGDEYMIFKGYGNKLNPVTILIHGGGLSEWMWKPQIEAFEDKLYIVTAIIDGHGEDYANDFTTIRDSANKIIDYINFNFNGKVFAICGLSLGAQITVEVLSQKEDISKRAIIESAMVIPNKLISKISKPLFAPLYPLIKKRWFSKLQAKQMYIPKEMFEAYYEDSKIISKNSLIQFMVDNAKYSLPKTLKNTTVKALIICGEKELSAMKISSHLLRESIKNSDLKIIPSCGHGVSIKLPNEYNEMMERFLLK